MHWDVEGKALWRWSSGGRASCGYLEAAEIEVRGREELEGAEGPRGRRDRDTGEEVRETGRRSRELEGQSWHS